MRDDETKRAERTEQIALFRYGLISDLLHPAEGNDERPLYVRLPREGGQELLHPRYAPVRASPSKRCATG